MELGRVHCYDVLMSQDKKILTKEISTGIQKTEISTDVQHILISLSIWVHVEWIGLNLT